MWCMTGYQADDADMVNTDAEAVLLYSDGIDINVASSVSSSHTTDSATDVADNSTVSELQQLASDVDLCDNDLTLPASGE